MNVKRKGVASLMDVLNNREGKALVEQIEELANSNDPILIEMREDLIKELKDRFGYDFIMEK